MHMPLHQTQSFYPQQLPTYTFYYDPSGQLCAANTVTGNHLCHNRVANRWYPMPSQPMRTNYAPHTFTPPTPYSPTWSGQGVRKSREHRRERSRGWEEYMYSTSAAKAAQLSLLEEEMSLRGEEEPLHQTQEGQRREDDDDDEDVDMFPDAAERRHRSRSAGKTYYPEAYAQEDEGWPRYQEPRDAMPGVARWLDDVGSVFSDEGEVGVAPHPARRPRIHQHPPQLRHTSLRQNPIRLDARTSSRGMSSPRKLTRPPPTAGVYEYRSPPTPAKEEKTLHRQDSGIDMSVDLDKDLSMDDAVMVDDDDDNNEYPVRHHHHHHHHHLSSPAKESKTVHGIQQQSIDDLHCYYVIPPPPAKHAAPTVASTTTTVYIETTPPSRPSHARRRSTISTPRTVASAAGVATVYEVPPTPTPERGARRFGRPTVVKAVPRAPSPPVSLPGQYHYQQQQQQQQQQQGRSGWGYVEVDARRERYMGNAGAGMGGGHGLRSYYPHTAGW